MKKNLFYVAAASALMLTACTSENDILEAGPAKQATPQEVGFDVYTPAATNVTRAGLVGTMTTGRLQLSEGEGGGFGVYAYLTEDAVAAAGDAATTQATSYTPSAGQDPNFMANEKILWNNANLGWYYNPLKYWPNETDHDSQSTNAEMQGDGTNNHLDRLTFFAYAPYVAAGSGSAGITAISDKNGQLSSTDVNDPTIAWTATTNVADYDPNEGVDLLWGVAPSGGLSYTAVNGWTVTRDEGTPLLNMIKPDVNTSMKFLFQHALARFGINVVAAVDQVAPGGELDPNTKITIESLKITGPFGTTGELDLNNETKASVAHWTKIGGVNVGSSAPTTIADNNGTITVGANTTNKAIAANLRWEKDGTYPHTTPVKQNVVGVTTAKQDLLAPSTKWVNKLASAPAYNPGKKYVDANGAEVHASYTFGTKSPFYTISSSHYVQATGTETAPNFPAITTTNPFYLLTETDSYENLSSKPTSLDDATQMYSRTGTGTADDPYIYAYQGAANGVTWDGSADYYTVEGTKALAADIPFTYSGDIYEAERNYLYVVPTNAALNTNWGGVTSANEQNLRTITLQIEYYISTEDSKLQKERAETKNVITKTVVLPSLANGKTYMLNLTLGLTSVKVEAEVDDWKVINVQADLPQNTAE